MEHKSGQDTNLAGMVAIGDQHCSYGGRDLNMEGMLARTPSIWQVQWSGHQ
jgi:hypothetical protein